MRSYGLTLLWTWMVDLPSNTTNLPNNEQPSNYDIKLSLVRVLFMLPITTKNPVIKNDSNLLQVAQRWLVKNEGL